MTTRISADEDQRHRHAPLVEIGRIEIPPPALEHRFFREARVLTQWVGRNKNRQEHVIGTKNTRQCELYGWTNDIPPHHDRTGFIYLCSLTTASSLLVVNPDDEDPNEHAKLLTQGTVLRLDDFRTHWTYDDGLHVCAFVGSFEQPDDTHAMALLTQGIQALAAGRYQGAPRVGDGYRVPLEDECYATADTLPRIYCRLPLRNKGMHLVSPGSTNTLCIQYPLTCSATPNNSFNKARPRSRLTFCMFSLHLHR